MQNRQGIIYVLVRISGPSRRGHPTGFGGAGTESALLWLRLRGWTKVEMRVQKCESCLYNLALQKGEWQGTRYGLEYTDYRANQNKTLTHNRNHPERGFPVTSEPFTP